MRNNMMKLIFCFIFCLASVRAFSNLPEDKNSIIEHYFTNPAGKSNFSNYAHKEIYFIKKQKKEGMFETSIEESFYQLILKPDANDNLIYLLIQYSDLTFSRDKIIAAALSKLDLSSDNSNITEESVIFKSLLSSIFYGRSKEFFQALGDELKNKKISLDLRNSDSIEYFVKKTEKQIFEKEHSSEFKDYRKALEELSTQEIPNTDNPEDSEIVPLHQFVTSKFKKAGEAHYSLDTGAIKKVKFSNIQKVKTISNLELGFNASDFRPNYVKANSSTIFIDSKRSSFPSGEYPNKLILNKDGKMVRFIVNNVKGYNRSSISLLSMYKDLKNSGVKISSFDNLIFNI